VLIILSGRFDQDAQGLVDRWSKYSATLLTAEDLSKAGWRFYNNPTRPTTAIVSGRPIAEDDITGILIRWPAIHEMEIKTESQEDRTYVSSEMTAFLRAWLSQLKCPVLNRPTASTLCGPAWRPERWIYVGAQLGIPVRRVIRRTGKPSMASEPANQSQTTIVTVVGSKYFGACDPVLGQQAQRLAKAAGVDLLAVHFDRAERGAALLTADPIPDLSDPKVKDAILAYLLEGRVSSSSDKEAG
jgi:hypothetical protein